MFRTPYRFCRITKEMIAALENEVETNLRLLKQKEASKKLNASFIIRKKYLKKLGNPCIDEKGMV